MKRPLLALLLLGAAGAASACSDRSDPAAPPSAAPSATPSSVLSPAAHARVDHLIDALERSGPALGESAEAGEVLGALRALVARTTLPGGGGSADAPGRLRALEAALDRLERRAPELAAEVDAIRLALTAYAADEA